MDDLVFEILKAAVNRAKSEQIKSKKVLKQRLLQDYPRKEAEIDQAFKFWASAQRKSFETSTEERRNAR